MYGYFACFVEKRLTAGSIVLSCLRVHFYDTWFYAELVMTPNSHELNSELDLEFKLQHYL